MNQKNNYRTCIGGIILLRNRSSVRGSKWFGKVSTVVFYACMLAMVLWHDTMSDAVAFMTGAKPAPGAAASAA